MKFSYKARTKEGKIQKGTIEASSEKGALSVLEKYGLYVTSLVEEHKKGLFEKELIIKGRISKKEVMMFTRQVGAMLQSAIPPLEILRTQVAQIENRTLRGQILRIAEAIETGSTMSQGFAMYPKSFSDFYISIIKTGEATGKVADAFLYLADHLEQEYDFRQKLIGAMVYPAFIVIVFIGAGLLVMFFILPRISEIFKSFNAGDLPILTRLLLMFSGFLSKGGWVIILMFVLVLFSIPIIIKRSKKAKKVFDQFSLKIPIVGEILKKIYLTRFAENLSLLLRSGLPITQSIKITKEILKHDIYQKILAETEVRVARGEMMSAVFWNYSKQFPPFVTQMVATGEETGRLDKTLLDIVTFYRKEVENTTQKLPMIIEPILIVILGVAVAFMAFAVYLPLFQLGMGGGME